jgi:hypothetical protein
MALIPCLRSLQLATLMHALVGAATVRGPGVAAASALVLAVVRRAGSLLGVDSERVAADTFRMWRVTFLPNLLRPDARSCEGDRVNYRKHAHALEDLIDPYRVDR